MKHRVLIVDDSQDLRGMLRSILEIQGYDITEAGSGDAMRKQMETGPQPDVVLLDLHLQDGDGLELLPAVKRAWPQTEVIILTGFASIDAAVTATKLGAYGFLEKPFDSKVLLLHIERALERKQMTEETTKLRQAISALSGGTAPVFQSASMKSVVRTVEKVAGSDVSVLLVGESGTGKEIIADLIHTLSPRASGPFVKVNCAALPRELIESELCGSVKGAYTGAHADRHGLFRQAEKGTLMLDEISEMPVDTQSKLLRVLQDKEVRPVGGKSSYTTDCRIIAATNRPVQQAIRDGKLREDLFYRISTITISLAPLRERPEDVCALANSFLQRYAAQADRAFSGFSKSALERLMRYEWPGNVRQLQNEIQRAVLIAEGPVIEPDDLSIQAEEGAHSTGNSGLRLMAAMERNTIVQVLKDCDGNKVEAAKRLGIGRQTLYNKLKEYDLKA
ncbi:MAG: sigma-54 dependent transcriptional regulator [Verrucomicrobiota bacterium]